MSKRDFRIGLLCYCFALFYSAPAFAIQRMTAAGAREAALSHSVVALPGLFSVFHNQAFLAEQRFPSLGISFRQPYSIPGYYESALCAVLPVQAAVLAVGITQAGVYEYTESGFGLSVAKKLTGRLSAGLFFNGFFVTFPETGSQKGSYQVDGGVKYAFTDKLEFGLHLRNLVHSSAETFQYNLAFPLIVRGGAAFRLTELLLLTGEVLLEKERGTVFRCGAEITAGRGFSLRGGISAHPLQHSFGFGYLWKFFQVDFAMVHHYLLGYSPYFSLGLRLR
jgi:hypothetical protein